VREPGIHCLHIVKFSKISWNSDILKLWNFCKALWGLFSSRLCGQLQHVYRRSKQQKQCLSTSVNLTPQLCCIITSWFKLTHVQAVDTRLSFKSLGRLDMRLMNYVSSKRHLHLQYVFVISTGRLKWDAIRVSKLLLEHVLLKHELQDRHAFLRRLILVSLFLIINGVKIVKFCCSF